mgnify:CR=1 FL=1|jgi:hypothetical protein
MNKWKKWIWSTCPECDEPITAAYQVRCNYCKVLFDWSDLED